MKPALYYTIRRESYTTSGFAVMRVTSLNARRVYGSINGISTHATPADIFGNFATEAEAEKALKPIKDAHTSFDARIRDAQSAVARAYADQRDAVDAALKKVTGNANQ